ncbi:MAG: fatty-acyl-CoA synthase [Alcanivorax sp.]|jgi:fatty-acyl-CoA synthase
MAFASQSTVYSMFRSTAKWRAEFLAIECGKRRWSYSQLLDVVDRLASVLLSENVEPGDRIVILSENRAEYTMLQLACARSGAIASCLNWRLAVEELQHCIELVEPQLIFASSRFQSLLNQVAIPATRQIAMESCLSLAQAAEPDQRPCLVDPEQGLLLLNTSGTTGLPKAALISHRAEIARMTTLRMDLNIDSGDAYLAWSPMNHIGGTEHSLSSLMMGSTVIITDGLDVDAICSAIGRHKLGWLLLMPATIAPVLARLKETNTQVRSVKVVGCMADLVPVAQIAEITEFLDAPFVNSFGSTETGLPPATGHLIPVAEVPTDLSKRLSSLCEFRLVDEHDNDVARGEIGEALLRGPTLFSGYWNAPEVNAKEFRDGWFRMGDLLRQTESGGFEFVGRSKYMIKSGGENIYPAEIERVLLADQRIAEAAVVSKKDPKWGEIVVAFIAKISDKLTEKDVEQICRARLAGYKRPREVHFIPIEEFPRSNSGKIIRTALEQRLKELPGTLQ